MRFSRLSVTLFVAAIALSPSATNAFSTGAGGCMAGQAAVGGGHLANPNIVTGTLAQGGFSVSVDAEAFPLTESLEIGETYSITVQGPDFRGVLIMSSSDGVSLTPTDALLQPSLACDALGFPGITHVSSEFKAEATGEFVCLAAGTHNVGVTVVVSNNNQEGSMYYYTGFPIECGESIAATEPPIETDLPAQTELPMVTDPPMETDPPVITVMPVQTDPPVITVMPVQTDPPVVTEMPVVTMAPVSAPTSVPSEMPVATLEPTDEMIVETITPSDNVTATDVPTDFNETEVPTLDMNESAAPVGPSDTEAPSLAPVAVGVPTSGAESNTPPSAAASATGIRLLSLGASVAAALVAFLI
jgi:hypothetical protein